MTAPRTYTTTTGEQMSLPAPHVAGGVARGSGRPHPIAELEAEADRLDVEADTLAEQIEAMQARRAMIALRRRSLRKTIAHLRAMSPFTKEEDQ